MKNKNIFWMRRGLQVDFRSTWCSISNHLEMYFFRIFLQYSLCFLLCSGSPLTLEINACTFNTSTFRYRHEVKSDVLDQCRLGRLTPGSEVHTCPRDRSYCWQRGHERCPGCPRPCSSYLSAARTEMTAVNHKSPRHLSNIFQSGSHTVTHCPRKARTRSGVARRWAWPCACRPEDTPPPGGFHQSARRPNRRRSTAGSERRRPCLQSQTGLWRSSARWTAARTMQHKPS